MIKIKIKFFGLFKEIFGPEITLDVKENSNLKEIKAQILNDIFENKIDHLKNTFNRSLFSNETEILHDDYILKNNDLLYILPPFSGG